MPTTIKAGVYNPPFTPDGEDGDIAQIYIDSEYMQVYDENNKFIFQLTFAEIMGVMAIMTAEQDTETVKLKALIKRN